MPGLHVRDSHGGRADASGCALPMTWSSAANKRGTLARLWPCCRSGVRAAGSPCIRRRRQGLRAGNQRPIREPTVGTAPARCSAGPTPGRKRAGGGGVMQRRTASNRLRRTKKLLGRWGRSNRHAPLQYQYQRLCSKLRGHCQYYGMQGNFRLLEEVRRFAERAWRSWLSRRSRRSALQWEKCEKLMRTSILPLPRIVHDI